MISGFLSKIIEEKNRYLEQVRSFLPEKKLIEQVQEISHPPRPFKGPITRPNKINLIAEIKKASASQGILREDFDPVEIAKVYEAQRASSLSILTEEKFFLGKPSYINMVKEVVSLPILRKDFIVDKYQIYESAVLGADAILLIAKILTPRKLSSFLELAEELKLDCLVEVHDEKELKKVLDVGADIIGINNRNLETFIVNLEIAEKLIPLIPKDKAIVVESGIKTKEDIISLEGLGANAVLIGEVFMRSDDIAAKIEEIMPW